MDMDVPNIVLLAGPNGAGKSTTAKNVIRDSLGIVHYVNADALARGLSEFAAESMAFKAARIMLEHLHDLARERVDFALETTLSGKTYAPWIGELKKQGFLFSLFFLWLPSADMAIDRVKDRVRRGGHDIPEETIRRRYEGGLKNFFRLYAPMADFFKFYNNSNPKRPRLIAEKNGTMLDVKERRQWESILSRYGS
jgi:predicted ABC-type ATPase